MNQIQPISSSQRLELVDALRGFAIFGILMVNFHAMFIPVVEYLMIQDFGNDTPNVISSHIVRILFFGKFMPLFSLLFGFGFYSFMFNNGEFNPLKRGLYKKRMFWLLIIGILHVSLLWPGDILIFYALFGFLLVFFAKSSFRKIWIWMTIFMLLPLVFIGLLTALPYILASNPEALQAFEEGNVQQAIQMTSLIQDAYVVYSSGTYSEIINMNWQNWMALLLGSIFVYCQSMAMFLLGFLIGRKQLFHNYIDHLPSFRKIIRIGLPIAIVFNICLFVLSDKVEPFAIDLWFFLMMVCSIIGGISLMLVNVSIFVLLYANGKINKMASMLAAVGRMALTNYIGHSFIALFLAMPFGLGLYGKIELWQSLLLTVVIFVLQIFISRYWLSKFNFGPLEWLWRTLTYGKIQSFRKR